MRKIPWLIFALIFLWKILLLAFSAQPIPANDAFFYDGAVIHHLLHGGFYNPCVALGFPISGRIIFSAYPPFYQLPLLGWMSVFGTSALSAMAFHLFLFGIYLLVLFAILRQLNIPAWCINTAAFFLLTFTFHDRPDSVAHALGIAGFYCIIRSLDFFSPRNAKPHALWSWLATMLIVLAFATSLQIGAFYFGLSALVVFALAYWERKTIPWLTLSLMVIVPGLLVFLVKQTLPEAWAGFLENVRQTPFLSGFRQPSLAEILKIVRTVPGIFMVSLLAVFSWRRIEWATLTKLEKGQFIILGAALIPAWGIILGSLTVISANTVAIANYLQPLIVALYLALVGELNFRARRWQIRLLVPCILLGAIRALGMSTWGLACAADVNYGAANRLVATELAKAAPGSQVVMSSAFLYGAAANTNVSLIHSDWMEPLRKGTAMSDDHALLDVKPDKLILTQFDYYRRYQGVIETARNDPHLKQVEIKNAAKVRPPDAYKSWQQILQHVSWAPVIIELTWDKNP